MECHMFCHNELPMLMGAMPMALAVVGMVRSRFRRLRGK